MAETLTAQQYQAVTSRDGNLLVAAAAGSGKTKVLVDRVIGYLMDEENPANLDDFLIITYTKAAAAELRGKIASKLAEKMAQNPENCHLQRQMQRLYLTKISTVHSFCSDLLKEHAYRLDLPGDFRVAEENECRELREMAMTQVLDEIYDCLEEHPQVHTFLDTQGLGRDDRSVPKIVMKVYDSAQCHADPDKWLESCVANAQTEGIDDAGKTSWGQYLIEDLFCALDLHIESINKCLAQASEVPDLDGCVENLQDLLAQMRLLRMATTWDAVYERLDIRFERLTFPKKCMCTDLVEKIKVVRTAFKDWLEKKRKNFTGTSAQVLEDMKQCTASTEGLVQLVRQFSQRYRKLKRARRVLDFGDLEQNTLDLLLGKGRNGITNVAKETASRFREIMVDEYQDSNGVQDAIFMALTAQRNNCFMVGDVKQSIYQFRLADPGIFLEKYQSYANPEEALPGQGRKILLSHNFRSGDAVLQGVNDVFSYCMSRSLGGLAYGQEESLKEGIPHIPLGEAEVELLALEVNADTYLEEATLVAKRIKELLDGSHMVREDQDTLRPIRPEDIAILMRSPGSTGRYVCDALKKEGIRCVSGGGEDLLKTEEIEFMRSLLQVIDNPRQDVPLLAVLASPVFGFTADDLAQLRGSDRYSSVYDLLLVSENPKGKTFLDCLKQLRKTAYTESVTKLVETIFTKTRIDSLYSAMPDGNRRKENLLDFFAMVSGFEQMGQRRLGHFLAFLDNLEKEGLKTEEQNAVGAVSLMSIHKSKGLEFPVVIVCNLSKTFNAESLREQVLCDRDLGLGLAVVDEKKRLRYPTIAKRTIAVKMQSELIAEELRVLYVALTRARDRLIMTYASGKLDDELSTMAHRMKVTKPELLCREVKCPGQWVLLTALQRLEAGELFALGGNPGMGEVRKYPWKIRVMGYQDLAGSTGKTEEKQVTFRDDVSEQMIKGLTFQYAYQSATVAPSKQTATQRKGRQKDLEVWENAPKERTYMWRKPEFGKQTMDGASVGNAVHRCMQYIRYENCGDISSVTQEIHRLELEGFLTPQQVEVIPCGKIANFFQTPLGEKLRSAPEVLREFKFSVLQDANVMDKTLETEKVLLQGVVDCALVEEDGITVVDFKTDRVTSETVAQRAAFYGPQLQAYADALSRIYEKPVKETVLYFFHTEQFISVCTQ